MKKSVGSAITLSSIIMVIATVLAVVCMKFILQIMQTPNNIFNDAYDYIVIISYGIFAQVLYNLLSCLLRALGNSKVPLYFLIVAAILNIFLDLIFIIYLNSGVKGAAYATIISQFISALLCIVYIIKCVPLLHISKDDLILDKEISYKQLKVGIPMAIQYSITAIGSAILQSSLNLLGSLYITAYTTASKIDQIVTQAYVALGVTMATFCAQNAGAIDITRVKEGFKWGTVIGIVYSVVFGFILYFYGHNLTILFISEDLQSVISLVSEYLKTLVLFLIPLTIVNVYRNGIQGLEYSFLPTLAGVAELFGRGLAGILSPIYHSYFIICLGGSLAWIFAGSLLLFAFYKIIKGLQYN